MTWRWYLKFLRPLRSLAAVATHALMAWALGEMWWRNPQGEAVLPALVVALPLICGLFVAGAAHEPMHQPLAAMLPGLRRSMRAKAAVTTLIMTVAVTLLVYRLRPEIPFLSSFGLIGAAMAAPCLGQHRHPGDKWELLLLVVLWALTVGLGGTRLSAGMNTAPLLWLLGGVGAAWLFLALGFSAEVCRLRANTRFLAPQTMFFNFSMMRDLYGERQMALRQKTSRHDEASRLAQAKRRRVTTWDWLAALRFGQAGSARQMPMWKAALMLVAGYLLALLIMPTIGSHKDINPQVLFSVILYTGFMVMQQVEPAVRVPVSRKRLADLVFRRQVEILAFILCVPMAAMTIAAWTVYGVAGVEKWLITPRSVVGAGLLAAAVFPWLMTCGALARKGLRITSTVMVGTGMIMLIAIHEHLQFWVLSLPGILTIGLVIGLGLALLRWRLGVLYGQADLSKPVLHFAGPLSGSAGGWRRKNGR